MKREKSSKCKKIIRLNSVDGKVVINPEDKEQVKWFKEFKK